MHKIEVKLDILAHKVTKKESEKITKTISDACNAYLQQEYGHTVVLTAAHMKHSEMAPSGMADLLIDLLKTVKGRMDDRNDCKDCSDREDCEEEKREH
jgi:hypothetical protein